MLSRTFGYIVIAACIYSVLFMSCNCKRRDKPADPTLSDTTKLPKRTVIVPDFNADSAYSFIQKQVSFGPRIPATSPHEKCAEWLVEKLKSYTPGVIVQEPPVGLYDGRTIACKNIIASFDPEKQKRILLFAHWDTRPWSDRDTLQPKKTFEGADDGGSGVGVLLEIARQLSKQKTDVGIDIAFFDVEDYGPPAFEKHPEEQNTYCLGSQEWAQAPHVPDYRAYYGILLDMVGAKNAQFLQEGVSLQYAPSVVRKVWDSANSLGFGNYFIPESATTIADDHAYVNSINGTPSIDIIHLDKTAPNGFARHWHTQRDNMSIIDKNTLKAVGQTVLFVIYNEASEI